MRIVTLYVPSFTSDLMLASASNAIVLGFNVKAEPKAASQAQSDGVDLRNYSVIYDVINDVKAALSGMLAPEIRETVHGRAQVKQLFPISKVGTIFGCAVIEGKIIRTARVRIKRGDTVLGAMAVSGGMQPGQDDECAEAGLCQHSHVAHQRPDQQSARILYLPVEGESSGAGELRDHRADLTQLADRLIPKFRPQLG